MRPWRLLSVVHLFLYAEVALNDEAARLPADIHAEPPVCHPYLLLPPARYQHLMALKGSGRLSDRLCKCPDANFRRIWASMCKRASVSDVDSHDLRRTCITEWIESGVRPYKVRRFAGHADLNTTMEYYVGIRSSVISRAKQASRKNLSDTSIANLSQNARKGQVWSRASDNSTFATVYR